MATKKLTRAKKPAAAASVKPVAEPPARTAVSRKVVWTAPIVMLMLIVAAGGLLIAARETSSTTSTGMVAATPAVSGAVMAPSSTGVTKAAAATATASSEAAAATTPATPATAVKPVSITGCLQRGGDGFVLKNTEGAAAPKSRSWKSGFLKRSASSIDLSDANDAARLGSHVGQRVTVTGPLVDRDMRVLSLRRIAASCS